MNKWMVLTPGRTGSTFIAESISKVTLRPFGDTNTVIDKNSINDIDNIINVNSIKDLNFKPGDVWHSHNLNSLNFVDDNTQLIINTRSMFQTAVSHEVARLTKIFHFKNIDNIVNFQRRRTLENIKPFEIAPADFINQYNSIKYWYMACKKIIDSKSIPHTVVDYSEFGNNNKKLFEILNLPNPNLENVVTKIPYDKENLITNLQFLQGLVDLKDDSAYNIMTHNYE
jgi:hypothetical protein